MKCGSLNMIKNSKHPFAAVGRVFQSSPVLHPFPFSHSQVLRKPQATAVVPSLNRLRSWFYSCISPLALNPESTSLKIQRLSVPGLTLSPEPYCKTLHAELNSSFCVSTQIKVEQLFVSLRILYSKESVISVMSCVEENRGHWEFCSCLSY